MPSEQPTVYKAVIEKQQRDIEGLKTQLGYLTNTKIELTNTELAATRLELQQIKVQLNQVLAEQLKHVRKIWRYCFALNIRGIN